MFSRGLRDLFSHELYACTLRASKTKQTMLMKNSASIEKKIKPSTTETRDPRCSIGIRKETFQSSYCVPSRLPTIYMLVATESIQPTCPRCVHPENRKSEKTFQMVDSAAVGVHPENQKNEHNVKWLIVQQYAFTPKVKRMKAFKKR